MVNAGKSKFLNVLYNISYLECKTGISTRNVNILRYNPNIKQPCFYHLKIEKKGDNYIFYKDLTFDIIEGGKNIIEANKNINESLWAQPETKYDDLFYMTEINEIPFIKDKEYLQTHDLCDIPGLSEYQKNKNNEIKEKEKEKNKENSEDKNIEKKEVDFEDDIFQKIDIENEHTYLTKIFKIIKNSKFQTFNINLNTFIPLSVNQLKNELLMDKSFKYLINYHFYNYMVRINEEKNIIKGIKVKEKKEEKSFINHLIDIIKTVGGIKKEEIESKVEKLNERENINVINKKIIAIINEIKNNFSLNEINIDISEQDFNDSNDDELPDLDNMEITNNDDIYDINPSYIIKFYYICFEDKKQKLLIPSLSPETINLLNYFTNKKIILKLENNSDNEDNKIEEKTKINREIINHLNEIRFKFEDSKFYIKEIENIIAQIKKIIINLKIYDVILMPFIGAINSGKTTIINGIIGKELLPTDLNVCTKRGILIRYDDEEETTIRKASFVEEKFLDITSYYFEAENSIGKGIKQVRETLQGLNLDFNKNEKDSFYYIRTRIKLFDDLGLSNYYKKMIYLVNFPGYGTGNVFEAEIYQKVMSICNAFIFVVRNSVIKEHDTKKILYSIFTQAKEQKNKFANRFIKSCLFIFNNDITQSTEKNNLEIAKK